MRRRVISGSIAASVLVAGVLVWMWANHEVRPEQVRLEQILALLELDSDLFWRQRPGLDTTFEGTVVCTDDQGFRIGAAGTDADDQIPSILERGPVIVVLGASPTFGYGIELEETYASVIERSLSDSWPGIQVINGGQIGYTTWQGLRLLRRHAARWKPDLVTVSYVVNDVDRLRFFHSDGLADAESEPPSEFRTAWTNLWSGIPVTSSMIRTRNRLLAKLVGGMSRRPLYERTRVRVPMEDYRSNLLSFVELTRELGVSLAFIKMPLRLFPEVSPLKASREYYEEGLAYEQAGNTDAAKASYDMAMKAVIGDCVRDAARYNQVMEEVAMQTGTPLIDPTRLLGREYADVNLYVPGDYIHPNSRGHQRIADCAAPVLKGILSGTVRGGVQKCE
jgi:lysophospholipase L1-like esterase